MTRQRRTRPIYMVAQRLVDPRTGAEVSALVPRTAIDLELVRHRGLVIGDTVRAELRKPRNIEQHRRIHALGKLVRDNIEGFAGIDPHEVIKTLQREAGVECDIHDIEVPGEGVLRVTKARSLAFDEMDESEFRELFLGICRHIVARYWPQSSPEEIDAMIQVMPGEVA